MVIIKIWGGLGNQLFQYYFGVYLNKIYKYEVKYHYWNETNNSEYTSRDFMLNELNLIFAKNNEILKCKFTLYNTLFRLERHIIKLFPFLNSSYFIENKININHKFQDNIYYDGYWQSSYYLKHVKDIIDSDYKKKIVNTISNHNLFNEIKFNKSVSLHIRRGDLLNNSSHFYKINDVMYYKNIISNIRLKYKFSKIYIFSDDLIWIKSNLNIPDVVLVQNNTPFVDLILMSLCKINIIENSTFSWWAAWFNTDNNIVITSNNTYLFNFYTKQTIF